MTAILCICYIIAFIVILEYTFSIYKSLLLTAAMIG
jgi:hypothetical protein